MNLIVSMEVFSSAHLLVITTSVFPTFVWLHLLRHYVFNFSLSLSLFIYIFIFKNSNSCMDLSSTNNGSDFRYIWNEYNV